MSSEANKFAVSEIARLSFKLKKLEKFYDDIQSAMEHYTGLNHLGTMIDEATEECTDER